MMEMAKLELKYIQAFKDRHGKARHYFRKPGFKRVSLPGEIGSKAFMAAYAKALEASKPTVGEGRTGYRTIDALMVEYYRSADWKKLQPITQATYRNMLDRFRAKHGAKTVANIETRHLEAIFHSMSDTPGAVRNLRKRLRKVFRLAVRLGWRPDNPVTETEAPEAPTEGFTPWSEEDIAQFEAFWPEGSRERLALHLLLYTGVRRSNVTSLGRQHVEGGRIKVVVYKGRKRTPTTLLIPIHPVLQQEIDRAPLGMTFITTQYGAPFTHAGFTQWFVERAEMAGVHNRTPHGLRKAAGRRLAEAGCSSKEIAAITGHKTLSQVELYTRDADQARLADRAMTKLRGEA